MAKKYEDFGIQELQAKLSMFAIEDHRVEANWGFIYLGSKYYFNQLKSGAINRVPTDLAQLVLAARCEAEHLVHPFFRDFYNFTMSKLRETEGKTMVASVRVGDQIIEKYIETIKNFLQQKKDEEKKEKQEEEQEEGFSNGSSPDGNEPEKSDDYDPLDDIDIKDLESILDEYAEEGDVSTEEIKEEIFTRFSTEEGNYKEETRLDLGLDLDINEALSGDFDDIMGEAKRQFEEQLDAIKEKLSEFSPPSPERNIDLPVVKEDYFKMSDPPQRPFYGAVNRLKQTFRKIELQNETEEFISEQGLFDTDLFLQGMLSNQPQEMFVDEDEKEGMVLVLLMDGSSSMYDGSLETAKKVGLSMYETARDCDGIDVSCWIFSGEDGYTPIQELNENQLARVKPSGWTHTNDAIRFVTQQPQYQGKRCVLFLVTDGCPMSGNDKYSQSVKKHKGKYITYIQADTHFAVKEARDRGWKVFTFFIGNPMGNSGIFGQPFVSMKKGGELTEVLDHFEKEVAKYLRK